MNTQAVEVEILGKITRVNCPVGQESALVDAAKALDLRIKEMAERTKVTNEMHLLTIAALNICYEMKCQSEEHEQKTQALSQKIIALSASLDQALDHL